MQYISHSREARGMLLHTTGGNMLVAPVAPGILRVAYTVEGGQGGQGGQGGGAGGGGVAAEYFPERHSLAVLPLEPFDEWEVAEDADDVHLRTTALHLSVSKKSCAFTYRDSAGALLTREPARGGKTLTPFEAKRTVFELAGGVVTEESVDGPKARAAAVREEAGPKAYHTKLEFEWAEGEALYGLGSHEEGILNLRGHHRYLYQQNMKAVVPFLVSTRGYGVLVDTYSLATFHDDVYGSYIWTEADDYMDFYFVHGPTLDQVVAGYRRLTGRAPLLPLWAYGYAQSKERYETQAELVAVVQEYRQRRIPLDCIVLDWRSWVGEQWGQKTLDPDRFPAPDQLTADIHALNARLMVSVWPTMMNGGADQLEMLDRGYMLGNRATYDAFNPAARSLYWKQANDGLFSHGIDAWWCDCTEPFEADWVGIAKPEPEERLVINTGEAKRYLDPRLINAYSLVHSRGIYEGQRAVTSAKRVVNLTRSSYAGQQRYGTITWSGDIAANWDTLRRQIPEGLNFCASGCPYWTLDIGAFFVAHKELWFWDGRYNAGCDDLGYRELYTRWLQLGAFLPMFRSHGTDTPREAWRFGEPGTPFYDAIVRFIDLRYQFLPYTYSVAAMVTRSDYTMMRALAFDFPRDARVHAIGDQFMFGPALMACPVTKPMYYEADSQELSGVPRTRDVYLPQGFDWWDFWTGRRIAGGQVVEAAATIDTIPLFVRAGSIVPMVPRERRIQHSGEVAQGPLEIRVYPGADCGFVLYEDSGDGYAYEAGEYATTRLSWNEAESRLTVGPREGSYEGMGPERELRVVVVGSPSA